MSEVKAVSTEMAVWGPIFALVSLTVLAKETAAMPCWIGQEPDPDSHGRYRWVIPVRDPCQCTEVHVGSLNAHTPDRPFGVVYRDTLGSSLDEIRAWLNCADPCLSFPCKNGGACRPDGSSFLCECTRGFLGKLCDIQDPCISHTCMNGGTCHTDGDGFSCNCITGYYGINCEDNVTYDGP